MTRNDNLSRLSGRWRNITKECSSCEFKINNFDNKLICNYGKLRFHLSTKRNYIWNKCRIKKDNIL